MIHKKEFYFIRHGQTDFNVSGLHADHIDIPLNDTGRQQANNIEKIITTLPIKSICYSPLSRAKETKNILCAKIMADEYEIHDLTECSGNVWMTMTALGKSARLFAKDVVQEFFHQVQRGINQALSQEGPVLIVAHGGVHWAMCCLMDVEHEWAIDNCIPVHFSYDNKGAWKARKLI